MTTHDRTSERLPAHRAASSQRGPFLDHLPGLDGLRGVAVLAVLVYHAELGIASGGHLGVTLFFVLSGFLITTRLLFEHQRTGRIDLARFWARRVRRLVPAALLGFLLAAAYLTFGDGRAPGDAVGDGVASLFSVANWRFVLDGAAYADTLDGPSPFQHYWSLSIEEQFYVALPLVAAVVLGWGARRRVGRVALAGLALAGVAVSTYLAASMHGPGMPPLRSYFGTDTRIAEPLVGVLLAIAMAGSAGLRQFSRVPARAVSVGGAFAAGGLALLVRDLAPHEGALYDGGLLLAASLSAAVIAAASQPQTAITAIMSWSPLQALGRISYGVYVFHWPIFLWLSPESTGLSGTTLFALRVAGTLSIAAASYHLIEEPVRQGALSPPVALVGWANGAVAALAIVVVAATLAPSGPSVFLGADPAEAAEAPPVPAEARAAASSGATGRAVSGDLPGRDPTASGDVHRGAEPAPAEQAPTSTVAPPERNRSAAVTRVAVVGDSLAANLADGLTRWAEERGDVVVYNLAIQACPLSRGGFRRWPARDPEVVPPVCAWWSDPSSERSSALVDFDPDVIIIEDAINEIPDRYRDEWGRYVRPQEPTFSRWLSEEYQTVLWRLASRGARTLILNAPCVNWRKYGFGWQTEVDADSRVLALNQSVYTEASLPGAEVADLHARICPNGGYSDEVEGDKNGRPDGMHLSETAAYRLASTWLGPLALGEPPEGRRST